MRPANGGKAGQDIKVTYGREAAREAGENLSTQKYKYKNTNTNTQKYKYKYKNTMGARQGKT